MRSAFSVSEMWVASMTLSGSNWSTITRIRVSVWNVRGPTKFVADFVMTTGTWAPRCTSWETTSAALKAAMEPPTPTTTVFPSSGLSPGDFFAIPGPP